MWGCCLYVGLLVVDTTAAQVLLYYLVCSIHQWRVTIFGIGNLCSGVLYVWLSPFWDSKIVWQHEGGGEGQWWCGWWFITRSSLHDAAT